MPWKRDNRPDKQAPPAWRTRMFAALKFLVDLFFKGPLTFLLIISGGFVVIVFAAALFDALFTESNSWVAIFLFTLIIVLVIAVLELICETSKRQSNNVVHCARRVIHIGYLSALGAMGLMLWIYGWPWINAKPFDVAIWQQESTYVTCFHRKESQRMYPVVQYWLNTQQPKRDEVLARLGVPEIETENELSYMARSYMFGCLRLDIEFDPRDRVKASSMYIWD